MSSSLARSKSAILLPRAPSLTGLVSSPEKRQGQYRPPGFIFYDHHQGRIVVSALFSQLSNFALGIRKCSCKIWQIRNPRIIFDPVPCAYCEEISRHRTPPRLRQSGFVLQFIDDGRRNIDADQRRVSGERRSSKDPACSWNGEQQ